MTLDFQALSYNVGLVNCYNELLAKMESYGDLLTLCNDYDVVHGFIEEAKEPLLQLLEDTLIEDPDAPIELCPNCEEANNNQESFTQEILPTFIEVNPNDKCLRAVMTQDNEIVNLTDWVDYEPEKDAAPAITQALRLMADIVERKFQLSQLPKDEVQ